MGRWTSLVVLSLAVVSTLSFPHPDEYKIPNVGVGSRAQYYVLHSDGSYKYGYDTGDGIYEQSMAQQPGDVSGGFGYKDPTGADIKLEYTADDRGFIATGDHLPVAPEAPVAEAGGSGPVPVHSVYSIDHHNAASPPAKKASFTPPVATYSSAGSSSSSASESSPDASYSFKYDAGDSSRSETADSNLNIQGSYSFVPPDTQHELTVIYRAGAATGFVAEGDHLPVAPEAPVAEAGGSGPVPVHSVYSIDHHNAASPPAKKASFTPPVATFSSAGSSSSSASESSPDASYSFKYDAGDSSRSETADSNLNIQGSYSFVPPDTQHELTVNYRAGAATGFVAEGDHLPVAPEAPVAEAGGSGPVPVHSVYSIDHRNAASLPAPSHVAIHSGPVEVAKVRSSASDDGSYSFSYNTDTSSRAESADAHNSVSGRYSFVADDGVDHSINYVAGAETGYIAEGDSLPVGPAVPGAESGRPTGRILPVLSEDEANVLAAATSGSSARHETADKHYSSSGQGTFIPAVATYSSAGSSASSASGSSPDASYSFKYDAGDSSRSETADSNLNIQGSYSFVPPNTQHELTVNYRAGAATGFVAEGDHLPVAPEAPVAEAGGSGPVPVHSVYYIDHHNAASPPAKKASFTPPVATFSSAGSSSSSASESSPDASYSFKYDAGDSSRSETADSNLNIQGSYSFVPPDTQHELTVNYRAGAATGFVAEGDHLPVAPEAPVAEAGGSGPVPVHSVYSIDHRNAASLPAPSHVAIHSGPVEVAKVRSSASDDGSYSFSYNTDTSSRAESADAHNSVIGRYSFVADDGVDHSINYVAGAETGYIAEGDSLPVGPAVPGAESGRPTGRILPVLSEDEANVLAAATSGSSARHEIADKHYSSSGQGTFIPAVATYSSAGSSSSSASGSSPDASYSFKYDAGDSSRSETADSNLNIQGSYSFVPPDTQHELTVNYKAGARIGFVAEGDHLPVAPEATVESGTSDTVSSSTHAVRTKSSGAGFARENIPHIPPPKLTPVPVSYKTSPSGHSSQIVGDVLLHQYASAGANKYGYVFTAVRR